MKWFFASLVIFILGFFNFFAPVRGVIQYTFNPVQFGFQQMEHGIEDWFSFYKNLTKIRGENLELLQEVNSLQGEIATLKEFETENKLLREQLSLVTQEEKDRGLLIAQTLGNSQDKTGSSLVLDKGSLAGVAVGDIIIQGKYLIGIVREATPHRSLVELTTSPNLVVSVRDFQTGTEGLSQGLFGTSILVNRILPNEAVKTGDLFVTSGEDGIFPPGYIIGEVTEVSGESPDVLKEVSLKTVLDFNRLGKVFVLGAR